EHQARALGVTATIESDHRDEYLASILHARPARWISRRIRLAERVAWPTGPDDEVFLPVDVIWICAGARTGPMSVRAHGDVRREKAIVEAACQERRAGQGVVSAVVRRGEENSIYRNRVLALRFETAMRDEDGDVEKPAGLRVLFAPEPRLNDG